MITAADSLQSWSIGQIEDQSVLRIVLRTSQGLYALDDLAKGRSSMQFTRQSSTISVLEDWEACFAALCELANNAHNAKPLDETEISWLPPVTYPRKLIMIGVNYRDHISEMGLDPKNLGPNPYAFLKPATTSLIGHRGCVSLPKNAKWIDWEAELGIVIGRGGRNLSGKDALEAVAGYTIINDVSARDWLEAQVPGVGMDWVLHKGFDTFTPAGPLITPRQFVPDPQTLGITMTVNGVVKQNASTSGMVFGVQSIIEHLSSVMTLEPGDMIGTGTPAGSGYARDPRESLHAGDETRAWVSELGELVNTYA